MSEDVVWTIGVADDVPVEADPIALFHARLGDLAAQIKCFDQEDD